MQSDPLCGWHYVNSEVADCGELEINSFENFDCLVQYFSDSNLIRNNPIKRRRLDLLGSHPAKGLFTVFVAYSRHSSLRYKFRGIVVLDKHFAK